MKRSTGGLVFLASTSVNDGNLLSRPSLSSSGESLSPSIVCGDDEREKCVCWARVERGRDRTSVVRQQLPNAALWLCLLDYTRGLNHIASSLRVSPTLFVVAIDDVCTVKGGVSCSTGDKITMLSIIFCFCRYQVRLSIGTSHA